MTSHLFVYGSLLRPGTLDAVLGHRHRGERLRATLRGYARATPPGWAYPVIVAHATNATRGVVLLDISEADLVRLDQYEDVADGLYERVRVQVEAEGCGPAPTVYAAWTYVGGTAARDCLAAGGTLYSGSD